MAEDVEKQLAEQIEEQRAALAQIEEALGLEPGEELEEVGGR